MTTTSPSLADRGAGTSQDTEKIRVSGRTYFLESTDRWTSRDTERIRVFVTIITFVAAAIGLVTVLVVIIVVVVVVIVRQRDRDSQDLERIRASEGHLLPGEHGWTDKSLWDRHV